MKGGCCCLPLAAGKAFVFTDVRGREDFGLISYGGGCFGRVSIGGELIEGGFVLAAHVFGDFSFMQVGCCWVVEWILLLFWCGGECMCRQFINVVGFYIGIDKTQSE